MKSRVKLVTPGWRKKEDGLPPTTAYNKYANKIENRILNGTEDFSKQNLVKTMDIFLKDCEKVNSNQQPNMNTIPSISSSYHINKTSTAQYGQQRRSLKRRLPVNSNQGGFKRQDKKEHKQDSNLHNNKKQKASTSFTSNLINSM